MGDEVVLQIRLPTPGQVTAAAGEPGQEVVGGGQPSGGLVACGGGEGLVPAGGAGAAEQVPGGIAAQELAVFDVADLGEGGSDRAFQPGNLEVSGREGSDGGEDGVEVVGRAAVAGGVQRVEGVVAESDFAAAELGQQGVGCALPGGSRR
jgi:hypothetical protein